MTETISVSVSGSAFALLLYENIKNEGDQDGFLVGNIISKETNKLTDADHRVVNKEHIVKIKAAVPCPRQFYFYDSSGSINAHKIKQLLGSQETEIVGWFLHKRKRNSSIKLNLREKIIHKQLANYFCRQVPYFSCCILTAECSNIRSTYSFCQTFVRYNMCKYENLPMHIINLSDPCYTFKSTEPASDVFNQVVKSVKSSGDIQAHSVIKKVQDTLQEHMRKMVAESTKKELELFKLEQEVKQLQCNQMLKCEYSSRENHQNDSESTEIIENGTQDSFEQDLSESNELNAVESSPDTLKKRRLRPRKQNCNNNSASPVKNCDIVEDKTKENESAMAKHSRTRAKANISYSEMTQKRKN